jgi:hypothetical protein
MELIWLKPAPSVGLHADPIQGLEPVCSEPVESVEAAGIRAAVPVPGFPQHLHLSNERDSD